MSELLRLGSPPDAGAFLARVVRVDPAALVRLRRRDGDTVALWTWLNVGVLAVRIVTGSGPADAVVAASSLLGAVAPEVVLPVRRDTDWRGPLPGAGFRRLDEIPVEVVTRLAQAGERTFREAAAGRSRSGARAVTDAVLDHVALSVTGPEGETADVPQRAVQALAALAFLGPDPVAVDVTGTWLRLAGTYGAVHLRRGTALGVL